MVVWGGHRSVRLRGFIAGPCGIGSSGGVFSRQLKRFSQTRLLPTIYRLGWLEDVLVSA